MHDVRAQVVAWISRNPDAVFDYPEIFSSEAPAEGDDPAAPGEHMQVRKGGGGRALLLLSSANLEPRRKLRGEAEEEAGLAAG
jgi:hypothetical protein